MYEVRKIMKVATIILHYNDAELTINYVNNLLKLDWKDYQHNIIIVDNNSPDGSGKILENQFINEGNIAIIQSKKNIGFAKGNNIGIDYAKKFFSPDLYIISNDDIVIEDKDFPSKLVGEYLNSKFAVWGPDVYSTKRMAHQSPLREKYLDVEELKRYIYDIDKKIRLLHIIDKLNAYKSISKIKKRLYKRKEDDMYKVKQYGVVLQGAFFVLSKEYIDCYPDGLYPGTFLYMEEDILNYRCKKNDLKVVYDPNVQVKHLEGVSTSKVLNDRCKKYIFELKMTRKSCVQMINYIKETSYEKN